MATRLGPRHIPEKMRTFTEPIPAEPSVVIGLSGDLGQSKRTGPDQALRRPASQPSSWPRPPLRLFARKLAAPWRVG